MMQARVEWFNRMNGFGFIKLDDGSKAYIHLGSVDGANTDCLLEGDLVSLESDQHGFTRISKL